MVFELLFIGFFLASMIGLIIVLILAMRGRRRTAMRTIGVLGAGWVIYLSVVLAIAAMMAARPQQTILLGQELCFDEMCFSVVDVQVAAQLLRTTSAILERSRPLGRGPHPYQCCARVMDHHQNGRQQGDGVRRIGVPFHTDRVSKQEKSQAIDEDQEWVSQAYVRVHRSTFQCARQSVLKEAQGRGAPRLKSEGVTSKAAEWGVSSVGSEV